MRLTGGGRLEIQPKLLTEAFFSWPETHSWLGSTRWENDGFLQVIYIYKERGSVYIYTIHHLVISFVLF